MGPYTKSLLVVLRALVIRKGYLHRDISIYNFFLYPEHVKRTLEEMGLIDDLPKFIGDILDVTK